MTPDEQAQLDHERVKQAANGLAEHFDAVQIFVSRHEAGTLDGTTTICHGAGNFLARYGQVKQWGEVQEEYHRGKARADMARGQRD